MSAEQIYAIMATCQIELLSLAQRINELINVSRVQGSSLKGLNETQRCFR